MRKLFIALAIAVLSVGGCANLQQQQRLADHLAALNHVSCYPFGLDLIGRGDTAAGIEAWKQCFAPDYKFSVFLGFDQPIECPGEKCTVAGATSIEKRAALARRIYDKAGYVRTSNHLTNETVTVTGPNELHVKCYISAWHFRKGGVDTGVGVWEVDLVRAGTGWLISNEKLTIVGAGGMFELALSADRSHVLDGAS
ncbi:MAG: nuclear transport factor 2 family protein [Reyranellales bacterium]